MANPALIHNSVWYLSGHVNEQKNKESNRLGSSEGIRSPCYGLYDWFVGSWDQRLYAKLWHLRRPCLAGHKYSLSIKNHQLKPFFSNTNILKVGQNIKFDIDIAKGNFTDIEFNKIFNDVFNELINGIVSTFDDLDFVYDLNNIMLFLWVKYCEAFFKGINNWKCPRENNGADYWWP